MRILDIQKELVFATSAALEIADEHRMYKQTS